MRSADRRTGTGGPGEPVIRLGLERMQRLLTVLDRPDRHIPCIVHVAGTNGKGSVAAMLAAILSAAGYRTALYTSPHLGEERDAFRAGGRLMTQATFSRLAARVGAAASLVARHWGDAPTRFECLTAMMYLWCAERRDEVLVQEVGLGGRLDATNAVERTDLAVITPVAKDHGQWLGRTVTAIAREKAGIIRPGVPVVTAATGSALAVIRRVAEEHRAPLTVVRRRAGGPLQVGSVGVRAVRAERSGTRFVLDDPVYGSLPLRSALLGPHQALNAATAATAARVLAARGRPGPIGDEAIGKGLATVRWPARLEPFSWDPPVLVDGAHNPAAMRALRAALRALFPGCRPVLIWGMLADKDAAASARCWRRDQPVVYTVAVPHPRAADPHRLAERLRAGGLKHVEVMATWERALQRALEHARGGNIPVCLCGSLYLAAAVRPQLRGWLQARHASS
ncbi:MAG TPA: cyanophycin synthetase [Bacillota bacterium]